MPDRIGLELLADRVRAVALDRRGRAARATADVAWDPARPEAAVAELRAALGSARRIGIAVGLAFLDVQRVSLPPVKGDARRRMIALDPSRVFPLREPVVVALADDAAPAKPSGADAERGEPAFAVARELVRRWTAAFETWGPVESVEPAPTALARALGVGTAPTDGEHRLRAAADEEGVVQVRGGQVVSVRRAPRWVAGDDAMGTSVPADPWRVARGAALGIDGAPVAVQLLPEDLAHGVSRRRAAAVTRAAALCGLAVGLALAAADRQRQRESDALARALRAELQRAAPAEALQARLAAFDAGTAAGAALLATRVDPLAVVAALGERLPEGAAITALRMQGDAWTIEGTARDAAALVPQLAGDPRLADVRALAPSSRYVDRGTPVETFSIAFRADGRTR